MLFLLFKNESKHAYKSIPIYLHRLIIVSNINHCFRYMLEFLYMMISFPFMNYFLRTVSYIEGSQIINCVCLYKCVSVV